MNFIAASLNHKYFFIRKSLIEDVHRQPSSQTMGIFAYLEMGSPWRPSFNGRRGEKNEKSSDVMKLLNLETYFSRHETFEAQSRQGTTSEGGLVTW